jgi:hypothetical protein
MVDWTKPIRFADPEHAKVAGEPKLIELGKNPGGYDCAVIDVSGAKTYYDLDGSLFGWCEEMRDGLRYRYDYKIVNQS